MKDQSKAEAPSCFGKAKIGTDDRTQEAADHNSQKCLGCLDRGPCIRSQDDDDPTTVSSSETT